MESNPYQSPLDAAPADERAEKDAGYPVGLIVLNVLTGLHVGVAGLLTLGGLVMGSAGVALGGVVAVAFLIAVFCGLLMRQEWARVMMIFLCYVNIVTYAVQIAAAPWVVVPLIGFEVLTLVFAHNPRVRAATRRKSLAQTYVYLEAASEERTEPTHER